MHTLIMSYDAMLERTLFFYNLYSTLTQTLGEVLILYFVYTIKYLLIL